MDRKTANHVQCIKAVSQNKLTHTVHSVFFPWEMSGQKKEMRKNESFAMDGARHLTPLVQTGLHSLFRNLLCVIHLQSKSLCYPSLANDVFSMGFVMPGLKVIKF